jgi:hypothetical protein
MKYPRPLSPPCPKRGRRFHLEERRLRPSDNAGSSGFGKSKNSIARGTPIRQIARDLAMARKSVRRCLGQEKCPESTPRRRRRSAMDEHREWVDARIAEGKIDASELHRALAERGVRLSYATVRRALTANFHGPENNQFLRAPHA